MRKVRQAVVCLGVSLLAALVLAGCHNDQQAAKETTRQLMEAMKSGNASTAKTLFTKKSQEKWNNTSNYVATPRGTITEYTLGEPVITEDTATEPVTVKASTNSQKFSVKLRKESGEWRVFALDIPINGMTIPIDFENLDAINKMLQGAGQSLPK